jgi:hypothetical protein
MISWHYWRNLIRGVFILPKEKKKEDKEKQKKKKKGRVREYILLQVCLIEELVTV